MQNLLRTENLTKTNFQLKFYTDCSNIKCKNSTKNFYRYKNFVYKFNSTKYTYLNKTQPKLIQPNQIHIFTKSNMKYAILTLASIWNPKASFLQLNHF